MEFYASLSVSIVTCLVSIIVSIITSNKSKKNETVSKIVIWTIIIIMTLGMGYTNFMLYKAVRPIDADGFTYNELRNEDYIYTIKVPSFMVADENNYAMEQRFNYGNADLVVKSRRYDGNIPYEFTRNYMLDCFDGAILLDYNQLDSEGWYVLAVKTNERMHYRKCLVNDKEKIIRMFTLSIPASQIEMYADIIDQIEESFKTIR